jgi:RecQ-mediated genome instability protein 1
MHWQVDEIINPSNPPERWYEESPAWVQKRFLKLSMTDGIQRLYGIEFEPIDDLKVSAPP